MIGQYYDSSNTLCTWNLKKDEKNQVEVDLSYIKIWQI
jgi:hypothetical protein